MQYNSNPIGVFDSGVGGISVLAELSRVLPNEDFIYLGDSKNAPYGTRPDGEILELSENCAKTLIDMGVKAIVIACNTATSVSAKYLREKYKNIPVIGIEPAVKPASEYKKGSKILVMATPVTLKKEKFINLIDSVDNDSEIIPLPCAGLVELIEQGKTDCEEMEGFLKNLLSPYFKQNIDCIVLGCTHYPFVKEKIKEAFPYEVKIFDGGYGTACETKRRIEENSPDHKGEVKFLNSDEDIKKIELSRKLFENYKKNAR